ncbi:SDR family NAD(P)-dependent oxidoreductase [Enterobacter hormaechei]
MLAAEFTGGYPSFGFAENTDDLFVGKTLLHGDVLMWLMKTLLTSGCTNQRGAGQLDVSATPTQTRLSDMKATFDVNLFGPVRVTQAFLPLLRAAKQARVVMLGSGVGSLALITDESSIYSSVNLLSYSASKVALSAVTVCFAKELAAQGIKVNVVEPGHVKTDLNGNTGDLTPEEGAMPAIRMALAEADGPTGKFFGPQGQQPW